MSTTGTTFSDSTNARIAFRKMQGEVTKILRDFRPGNDEKTLAEVKSAYHVALSGMLPKYDANHFRISLRVVGNGVEVKPLNLPSSIWIHGKDVAVEELNGDPAGVQYYDDGLAVFSYSPEEGAKVTPRHRSDLISKDKD